jgi:hypothetical protein
VRRINCEIRELAGEAAMLQLEPESFAALQREHYQLLQQSHLISRQMQTILIRSSIKTRS